MEQIFITAPHCSVTAACFFSTKYADLEPCFLHYIEESNGNLLASLVIGCSAAHEVYIVNFRIFSNCFYTEICREPCAPFCEGETVRIKVCLHVHECCLELWSHIAFHEDFVSSHVYHFGDVFNVNRACFHTCCTVCT